MKPRFNPYRYIIVSSVTLKIALLFLLYPLVSPPFRIFLVALVAFAVIAQLAILWRIRR